MGMERQRVVSIFQEEEALLCSGGRCLQPVLNGYPGQGSREGGGARAQLASCEKHGLGRQGG